MYKIYIGDLDGDSIYQESEDKQELVNLFYDYTKNHKVFTVTFKDNNDKSISDELDKSDMYSVMYYFE